MIYASILENNHGIRTTINPFRARAKESFLKRKKSGSGSISSQLRQAADMYLNSDKLNDSELELVSKLAKDAETTIEEMNIRNN